MSQDSRESERIAAEFSVRYESLDELVLAYTQDLSRGGMFLYTTRFLPINAALSVGLVLPDGGGELRCIARVVHIRGEEEAKASGKPPGMGVMFLDFLGKNAEFVERFIAQGGAMPESSRVVPSRKLRVVVVDDSDPYRESAAAPFQARGDEVLLARDGLEGLAACLKQTPDIVLSDVQMPKMDGWTLLRMIRARQSLADVPVIFLTTLGGESERLRGYRLGVDDYIAKPYAKEELVARVDRILSRKAKHPSANKALRGDLEQVGLASLLSLLALERQTGVLLVVGKEPAKLFVREGNPVAIEMQGASGSQADQALRLMGWTKGQFEFSTAEVTQKDEIGMSLEGLLLEAARVSDEAGQS